MKWLQTVPVAQMHTQTRTNDKYLENYFKLERIRSLIKAKAGDQKRGGSPRILE